MNAYRVLVGKQKGKRKLRKPKRKWEDDIEIDVREIGLGHGLAQIEDSGRLL
jgi:hypothetical protein